MAVTAFVYAQMLAQALDKQIDLLTDTIKVSLHTVTYTPSQDNDDFWNDATNEVSGTGYSAGGATLANDTFSYNSGTNTYTYDADDSSWTTATITARYAVVYDSTPGSSATDPVITYQDFGADFSSVAGTFQITWNANGIFTAVFS